MCGLVGLFVPADPGGVDRTLLRQMRDMLRHRGPDDAGDFVSGPIGLGHRRLSIIDLHAGRQPLGNEDGRIQIAYNGEVYNFRELRLEAEAAGHRFATHTDTEAIVHLYEELGDQVVSRLNGMFAFALWDGGLQRLLLARDRAGVKPLYYAHRDGRFAFASEIGPLLLLPWVSRAICPDSLDRYLAHGYVGAPRTMFRDIFKLPAAHTLVVDKNGLRVARYWSAESTPECVPHEAELGARLFAELDRSVRTHLVSDVPLGAFLSGGLDSSIVVALMRRHCTGRLKTFSVGVDSERETTGRELNECEYARRVARHLGTEHHELLLRAEDMPELLQVVARCLDEPVADAAAVPTFQLAKLARESVTVVLTGEGADETWGGYDVFRKAQLVGNYRRLPPWLRRNVTDQILTRLPGSDVGRRLVETSQAPGYLARLSHFEPRARRALYTQEGNAAIAIAAEEADTRPALDCADIFGSVARDLIDNHLAERLLFKVDRMTMAHSLEARVPVLDYQLIEFAFSVPARLKLRGSTRKYLLRQAFRDELPPAILNRPKHGFDLPCAAWLRSTLAPLVDDLLSHSRLSHLIEAEQVAKLWKQHRSGAADHATQIWALLTLELWARSFGAA